VSIPQCSVRNDSTGFAELLAWIVDHAPGPRLVVSIEGSRSYGVGLSRVLAGAGLQVSLRPRSPRGRNGAGRASPTPIDAQAAVLAARQVLV
jgi:transposase